MLKVITYGTFDLLHHGHIEILRRAKDLGDHLTVGLSDDEFNLLKGKKAYHTYKNRSTMLCAVKYVDAVIPEYSWEQKISDIKKFSIDIFVMGDDWLGKFDFLKNYCDVVYLERTADISTTIIKKDLNKIL